MKRFWSWLNLANLWVMELAGSMPIYLLRRCYQEALFGPPIKASIPVRSPRRSVLNRMPHRAKHASVWSTWERQERWVFRTDRKIDPFNQRQIVTGHRSLMSRFKLLSVITVCEYFWNMLTSYNIISDYRSLRRFNFDPS